MAKYVIVPDKHEKIEKNYVFPFINIVPAVVWSIPIHQKLFPKACRSGDLHTDSLDTAESYRKQYCANHFKRNSSDYRYFGRVCCLDQCNSAVVAGENV